MTSALTAKLNFVSFINWLNNEVVQYFVPWGYEELPEKLSGGDVDLYVSPHDYDFTAQELNRRGYTATKCPRYSDTHFHEHFTQPNHYTIDMFSSFCFGYKGKTTVLNVDLTDFFNFNYRIKKRNMVVAPAALEALFTCLRVAGGRTDCAKRLEKFLEAQTG